MEWQENGGPSPEEYRELLGLSYVAIRDVDGAETKQDALLDVLMRLEQWKKDNFDLPENDAAFRDDWEKMVGEIMRPNRPVRTIQDLLATAESRLKRIATKEIDPESILAQFKIVRRKLKHVLITPKAPDRVIVSGEGEWEPTRFEPRLQKLIHALREGGIYTDDLIAYTGIVLPNQMRKMTYVLLEIPRVGSEALVCNEVGEATFVSKRHLGHETYGRLNKEELEALPGVSRHVCLDLNEWSLKVVNALLEKEEIHSKIDVKNMETMRSAIAQRHDARDWLKMHYKEKLSFKFHGKGLRALADIFGVEGEPCSNFKVFMQLSVKIYGEENPEIAEQLRVLSLDREGWIAEIKKHYPSAKNWLAITDDEKRDLEICGKGYMAIAGILGLSKNFDRNYKTQILLAEIIYGKEDPLIEEGLRIFSLDENGWIEEIKKLYPSAEVWLKLNRAEKQKIKIGGKGMTALATTLGINGRVLNDQKAEIEFLAKIYGENDPIIKEQRRILSLDKAGWIAEIKKTYPTAESWLDLPQTERQSMRVGGKGIMALASLFGIKGNPASNANSLTSLAAEIYGKDNSSVAKRQKEISSDMETWIAEIKSQYPTAADWFAIPYPQKILMKINNKGLDAIAGIFGVRGKPLSNQCDFINLSLCIYGENDTTIKEQRRILSLDEEGWIEEIKKQYPDAERWVKMHHMERLSLKIAGKGLTALTSILGIKGHACSNNVVFLRLAEKIYGKNDPTIQEALQRIESDSPPPPVPGE